MEVYVPSPHPSDNEDDWDNCDPPKKVKFNDKIILIPILNENEWYNDYKNARIDEYKQFKMDIQRFEDKHGIIIFKMITKKRVSYSLFQCRIQKFEKEFLKIKRR